MSFKKSKRVLKIIFIPIAIILSLLVLLLAFFSSPPGEKLILKQASHQLSKRLGLKLEVAQFKLNLFRLKAGLQGINLKAADSSRAPLLSFSCDRLNLQAGWSSLGGQKVHIKNLEIVAPRLKLKPPVPAEEKTKSPAAPEKGKERSGLNFQLDSFKLTGGYLNYEDKAFPLETELENLEIFVRFQREGNFHEFNLNCGPLALAAGDRKFKLNRLQLDGKLDRQKLEISKGQLASEKSGLNLKLNIEDYSEKPAGKAWLSGEVNLAEVAGWLSAGYQPEGLLQLDLEISGTAAKPQVKGTVNCQQLVLPSGSPADLALKIDTSADGYYLLEGKVNSPQGNLNLQARLSRELNGPFEADVFLEKLNLEIISKLKPELPVTVPSTVSGKIKIKGPGFNPDTLEGQAEFHVRPVSSYAEPSKVMLPLTGEVAAGYRSGRAEINRFHLQALGVELSASGWMEKKGEISGQAVLEVRDLAQSQRQAEEAGLKKLIPGLSEWPAESNRLKGRVELAVRVGDQINHPRFQLKLNGRELSLAGLELPVLKAEISGTRDEVKLHQLLLKLNEGQVEAFSRLTRKPGSSSVYKLDGNINLSAIEISQLSFLLPEESRPYLNGKLNGSIHLGGTTSDPQLKYQVALTGLVYGNFHLESGSLEGEYTGTKISVEQLRLALPESLLTGRLTYEFNSSRIDLALKAKAFKLTQFSAWFPEIKSGQVDLDLEASGPLKNPVARMFLSGQGLTYGRFWFPYVELRAQSDGQKANFKFEVPRFNLSLEAGLELKSPYLFEGQLKVVDLPLSTLAGLLPMVEEVPSGTAVTAEAQFEMPLLNKDGFKAEFRAKNFDFEGLASLVPGLKAMEPSGSADFYLKMEGFPSALERFRLLAEIPNLSLKINKLPISNELPIRITFQNSRLKAEPATVLLGSSRLKFSGEADLTQPDNPTVDFQSTAELKLNDFNPWLTGMIAGGLGRVDLKISGTVNKPEFQGSFTLQDAFLRLQDLPVVLSEVRASVSLKGQQLKIDRLEGLANTGKFTGGGQALFGAGFKFDSAAVSLRLNDFDFNFQGLNTLSEAFLNLSQEKNGWLLKGDLNLLRASYREDFYPSLEGLKMAFARVSPAGSEMPAFLHDLLLDVNVKTVENIIIKNNLADLEMKADLNIKGTIPAPIIIGRVENAYFGQVVVSERKYTVERLRADFMGKENLEPYLDVYLTSTVYDEDEQVEVNLLLNGPVSDLQFSLNSSPSRSPEDLASLLLTGKSFKQVQGSAVNTITGQLMQQFSSPLTSPVTKTLKKVLKAEDVILEPLNIATLQDPGARLTIRKSMAPGVAVTYSVDLANSQRQAWILDYNWKHNLAVRGFRRDDGVVGGSFRHRFSVGGRYKQETKEMAAEAEKKLREIVVDGDAAFPLEMINKVLKLKTGKKFKNSDAQKALARLDSWYFKNGYLNARAGWEVEEVGNQEVRLKINIQAGTKAEIKFSGDGLPRKVRKKALNSWVNRLPAEANLEQVRYAVESELRKLGYYRALVNVSQNEQKEKVVYLVEVKKGSKWKIADFKLEGNPVYGPGLIKRLIADYFGATARGLWNLVYDQKVALELIDYFYQENGYLQAKIEKPVIKEDEARKRLYLSLKIEAGPQSRVHEVRIEGAQRLSQTELMSLLSLKPGQVFSWPALAMDRTAILNRYRSLGFKQAKVVARANQLEDKPDYDVIFSLEEGQDFKVSEVEVAGTQRSKKSFLLKTSGLKAGQPLSLEALARAQKNLYDSGAFNSVNVSSFPVAEAGEKVLLKVQEKPWLTLSYGLQYNTETRFEGFVETDFNNLLGYGWNGLIYMRANQRQQDARFSLKIPYLFARQTDLIASAFYLKDSKELYITEQLGASLQQKISIIRGFNLSWVYKFSRLHDYEKVPSWPFPYDIRVFTSELSLLVNRDTRDDKFDPKKGMLVTANLSYSPRFLGSSLNYVSTFTQASFYWTVGSGVTWASCYRLGLASAFGEYLIPSKRFYAGGGTSIRGFKLDAVGPIDLWTGLPEGGEAVLVINQELRFPIYRIVKGVAFFDAGNVYYQLRDFNPVRLRTGAGFGLRIETPLGLLRVDYGINLKPRPGEARSTIFFSLGQAF